MCTARSTTRIAPRPQLRVASVYPPPHHSITPCFSNSSTASRDWRDAKITSIHNSPRAAKPGADPTYIHTLRCRDV
ncbi:hypothetical protein K438DRAFT_1825935 [Mycena galopus ATCC 62051]|nr:hypothetical protein K438DRAFT_1825935 [Mycena galopus ATCC 62051]